LAKVKRNGDLLYSGKLASLKRFKDDVKEVQAGYECGLAVEGFNDIHEGDVIEFFVEEQEKQTLDG
jgi:translation initiation factor IF-2